MTTPTPGTKPSGKEPAETPSTPTDPKTAPTTSLQEFWLKISWFLEAQETRYRRDNPPLSSAPATPLPPELLTYPEVPQHYAIATPPTHQITQSQHPPPPPTTPLQPTRPPIARLTPTPPVSRTPPPHYVLTPKPRAGAPSTQIPEVTTLRTMKDRILASCQMETGRENRASESRRSRSTPSTRESIHPHTPTFQRCHDTGTPPVHNSRLGHPELLQPRLRGGNRT